MIHSHGWHLGISQFASGASLLDGLDAMRESAVFPAVRDGDSQWHYRGAAQAEQRLLP
jgi:hypothetical protein